MKDLKENELIEKDEEEKIDENKIKVLEDFSAVVTNIVIEPQHYKSFTSYLAKITIKGVGDIKVKVDENLVQYVKTCQKLGKQPFKSKVVVKEMNEEKQKTYICVKFISLKDNVYRYFISRADVETLELVFDDYNEKLKK